MRNLAQRSAQAAREIKSLMKTRWGKWMLALRWSKAPGKNGGDCQRCDPRDGHYGRNCFASDEQSRGIDQVGLAVAEMAG